MPEKESKEYVQKLVHNEKNTPKRTPQKRKEIIPTHSTKQIRTKTVTISSCTTCTVFYSSCLTSETKEGADISVAPAFQSPHKGALIVL